MTSERVIVVLAGNTTTPLHQLLTGASSLLCQNFTSVLHVVGVHIVT